MTETATRLLPERSTLERLFMDPHYFMDMDRWHRTAAEARREGAFHRVDDPAVGEFWACMRWAPLVEVSRNDEVFHNTEQAAFVGSYQAMQEAIPGGLKTLLSMDGTEHTKYRQVVVDWFKPAALRRLQSAVDALVEASIARLRELGGECDFATEVAIPLPLRVIMSMLGIPQADYPLMLKLTQQMFSADDPELGKGDGFAAMAEMAGYFAELITGRKARPTDDLASAIANATLDGEPLQTVATMGLYVVLASAGHDTTSFAMSGGVEALTRFPDQLERLRQDPGLADNAAHEIVRYTSPVRHFLRHPQAEVEIAGHRFHKGERILLCYPSANRDESVFPEPDRLDVGRANANRHVAWGHGAHYCLGARLAHMEIAALLRGLCRETTSVEAIGPATWTSAHFVSGVKRLPVTCQFRQGSRRQP